MIFFKKVSAKSITDINEDFITLKSLIRVIGDTITPPASNRHIVATKIVIENTTPNVKAHPLEIAGGAMIFNKAGDTFLGNPLSDKGFLYLGTDKDLYYRNDSGNDFSLTGGGGGGGVSSIKVYSKYTLEENIAAGKVVAVNSNGRGILASKGDSLRAEVVGIAAQTGNIGDTINVQKIGLLSGFSGLTPGLNCLAGDSGKIIQSGDSVAVNQYRTYLGVATSATTLDINVGEATKNEPFYAVYDIEVKHNLEVKGTSIFDGNIWLAGAFNGVILPFTNHYGDSDQVIPIGGELFSLNTIEAYSNRNRKPIIKGFEAFPSKYEYNNGDSFIQYNNLWNKWNNRNSFGVFRATTNLAKDPEDLTTGNWTPIQCTVVKTNSYWKGMRFSEVQNTGLNVWVYTQQFPFLTTGVHVISAVAKKNVGDSFSTGVIDLAGTTSRGGCAIKFSTQTINTSTTLIYSKWYGDLVEFAYTVNILATTDRVLFYSGNASGHKVLWTGIQIEQGYYPTPYTSTSRAFNQELAYNFVNRPTGAIECWFRPWAAPLANKNYSIWNVRGSGTSYLDFKFNDTFQASLYLDGSNYRVATKKGSYDKISNPVAPTGIANDATFSSSTYYMAVAHSTTPFLSIYKKMGDSTFTKITAPTAGANNAYGVSFLGDTYIALACNTTAPYLNLYKKTGDSAFTKCTTQPTSSGISLNDCAFSKTGYYIGSGGGSSPMIIIHKRFGGDSVYVKIASNVDTLPTATITGIDWVGDTFLVASHTTSPYMYIYKRMGTSSPGDSDFNKCSNPSVLPAGNAAAISVSGTKTYLAVAHANNPYISIYKKTGDTTWTKINNPETLPSGDANGCKFVGDTYLFVSHKISPWMTIYKRGVGDTFIKVLNPTTLAGDTGFSAWASSDARYYVASHSTSPYINIYKRNANTEYLSLNGNPLRTWHHAKVWWDIPNQFIKMRIDGDSAVLTNNLTAGTVTSLSPTPILHIGSSDVGAGDSTSSDCQITDFLVYPYGDSSTTHYTKNRPYYTAERVLGEDSDWMIDDFGNWSIGNDGNSTMTIGKDLTLDGRTNIPANKLYIGGTYLPSIDHLASGDELV